MLGVGLKPEHCGYGYGDILMTLIKHYVKENYIGFNLRLEVRDFNKRAFACYKKAGFTVIKQYYRNTPTGNNAFMLMEYCM